MRSIQFFNLYTVVARLSRTSFIEEDTAVSIMTIYVKLWCPITAPFHKNSGAVYDEVYSVFDTLQDDSSFAKLLHHLTKL
jgi:hypothetical protein